MVQPNSQYGNSVYFPYAAGSLIAYAFSDERIRSEYSFGGFVYKKLDIEKALELIDEPYFVGFSCYVWNYEYNKVLAEKIKEKYPDCKIAFGGHQVNRESDITESDFVDFCLLGEGEEIFKKLLLSFIGKEACENIPNIMYRKNGKLLSTPKARVDIPE